MPDEGAADLLVVRASASLSRWRVLQLFIAMESGRHLQHTKEVQCYKVRRVRLYPKAGQGSHLQLSGQEMRCAPVEVQVRRGVVTVRGLPVERRVKKQS